MRRPAAQTMRKPRIARTETFPAAVGGWIKNVNLATPDARMPDGSKVQGAFVLDNFFPEATGLRMRRGSESYAQVGADGSQPVLSLFSYINGANAKLFAATATDIYDVSSPAIPENELLGDENGVVFVDEDGSSLLSRLSVPTPAVVELTGGNWVAVQFATPGGVFLRAVNGVDAPLVFDGSDWAETPAITGVDAASLSHVWLHQRRLFFVKGGSLSAYYLPADSIGGAAVEIPLGGVFKRGGSLLFGASWSLETDNLSEQCVFVTTEGEVAVYQGTDPSSASTWAKVGTYRIGRPLGPKAIIPAGGDLVIGTDMGFVPLSQAVQRDISALSPAAISYPIETAWNETVEATAASGAWHCEVWPTKHMAIVAPPTPVVGFPQVFVANARTGAWGRYTGWKARCLGLFRDRAFFGSDQGLVIEAEVSGADRGRPYTAVWVPLFETFKAPASLKTAGLMRATVQAASEVVPRLSLQADYNVNLPTPPDDAGAVASNTWGAAIWGVSLWSEPSGRKVFQRWQSVGGRGYAIAPGLQITSGKASPPDVDVIKVEITYDQGDVGS
uniref:Phage protein n=1 Tax=Rhodopseudomonas palustris (strain DX-1) TaxID=652103 RepID=E6VFM7_RHOPX